jgi:hypothetical protein
MDVEGALQGEDADIGWIDHTFRVAAEGSRFDA